MNDSHTNHNNDLDLPDRTTIHWYAAEWSRMLSSYRGLVLTSKRLKAETQEFFFSQPFRFTGSVGWIMAYHFLAGIGHTGRDLLKNFTVCHPGFSILPCRDGTTSLWKGGVVESHLQMFSLKSIFEPYTIRRSIWYTSYSSAINSWTIGDRKALFDDAAQFLRDAKGLNKLKLTLPHFEWPNDQTSFRGLDIHEIFDQEWFQQQNLSRLIVLLTHVDHACNGSSMDRLNRNSLCLAELKGRAAVVRNVHGRETILEPDPLYGPEPGGTAARKEAAQLFLQAAHSCGWEVKEQLHNRFGQYPVQAHESCTNAALCRYMKEDSSAHGCSYECAGDTETQIQHEGWQTVECRRRYWDLLEQTMDLDIDEFAVEHEALFEELYEEFGTAFVVSLDISRGWDGYRDWRRERYVRQAI